MAPDTTSADIILNKTALLLAKNQRLVSSWLPPPSPSSEPPKSEAEIEKEEQKIFGTPLPELFGVGATLPKDGDVKRQDLSSNEKLRKQMLGNDYVKRLKQRGREGSKPGRGLQGMGSKPRPASTKREVDDDESEEDEGRSSLGKSRQDAKRRRVEPENEADVDATVDGEEAGGDVEGDSKPQKKASNYLDEVLAERSQKKRKKNKKKKHKRQIAET